LQNLTPATVNVNVSHAYKRILASAILILCTVLVYYPSLKVPFLLDDYGKIIVNPDIKNLDNIPSRLIYPYESPPNFHRNDPSRPLTYLTLTVNYYFSQLKPDGYHIVNIAIHGLVVLLIFALASLVFPMAGVNGIVLPFLSALFFAVHPVNVNVVTYVIGRAASLATLFYVSAVILFIQARRGVKWGIFASAICFVLALASNQVALTLPAVILVTDFCFFSEGDPRRVTRNWNQHGVYWGLLAIYLGMRLAYFGKLGDVEASIPVANQMDYILTQWVVLWKYASMTILPTGLSFEYLYGPLNHLNDPRVLVATVLYGILCVGIMRGLKSAWLSMSFGLFSVLWFLITLSPTSSVFPTTATMAENRVYLPLVGLCLIIPFVANAAIRRIAAEGYRNVVLLTVFGAYVVALGYITLRRNILYQDPIGLWTDVIQRYPNHERAHKNLALAFRAQGQFNQAADECEKALVLDPGDFDARNNLAAFYYEMGRYKDSLAAYREIVKEKPDYAAAYSNMGMAYEQLKNVDAAMNAYQNAIRLNPMLIEPLNNLGGLYLAKGRLREAAALYQAALEIDPHNAVILKNYKKVSANK